MDAGLSGLVNAVEEKRYQIPEGESASGGARTPDPCLRRALLYPAELLTR
jgi:hypothetical protein